MNNRVGNGRQGSNHLTIDDASMLFSRNVGKCAWWRYVKLYKLQELKKVKLL